MYITKHSFDRLWDNKIDRDNYRKQKGERILVIEDSGSSYNILKVAHSEERYRSLYVEASNGETASFLIERYDKSWAFVRII